MNILVTGANGQLGNEMRIVSKDSNDYYIFTDICDATRESIDMLHKLAGDDVDTSMLRHDITHFNVIRQWDRDNSVV